MKRSTKRTIVRLAVALLLLTLAACSGVRPAALDSTDDPEPEVSKAIREALPDLRSYRLVDLDDEPIVARLRDSAEQGGTTAITVELPVYDADGRLVPHEWVLYPHDVTPRNPQPRDYEGFIRLEAPQTSLTFLGLPDLVGHEHTELIAALQQGDLDESRYQAAALSVIGGQLGGTYFGNPDLPVATVIESLQLALEPVFGIEEAKRLASLSPHRYLIYRQSDFQPPVAHNEPAAAGPGQDGADHGPDHGPDPDHGARGHDDHDHGPPEGPALLREAAGGEPGAEVHAGEGGVILQLNPVMVAGPSVFDPATSTFTVTDWFGRVHAAIAHQRFFHGFAQQGPDVLPLGAVSPPALLSRQNNTITVTARIHDYVAPFPGRIGPTTGSCDYLGSARSASPSSTTTDNEFWMWWTTRHGGGCAFIEGLGTAPSTGAVGVTGLRSGTTDWTSFVYMHEAGHIIGGRHSAPGTHPERGVETWARHRCRLGGAHAFGPTGPSLMSYASGTRTYCFAESMPGRSRDKKNAMFVAEFLHGLGTTGTDEPVTALEIHITTGDDDMRAESEVVADLRRPDGSFIRRGYPLGTGVRRANGTTRVDSIPLSGVRRSELGSLTLRHDGTADGCCLWYDDGKVDRVFVRALTAAGDEVLVDRRGSPLIHFTDDTSPPRTARRFPF